jgi:hypothetical protein
VASDAVTIALGILAVAGTAGTSVFNQIWQARREKVSQALDLEREKLRQEHEIRRDNIARAYEKQNAKVERMRLASLKTFAFLDTVVRFLNDLSRTVEQQKKLQIQIEGTRADIRDAQAANDAVRFSAAKADMRRHLAQHNEMTVLLKELKKRNRDNTSSADAVINDLILVVSPVGY